MCSARGATRGPRAGNVACVWALCGAKLAQKAAAPSQDLQQVREPGLQQLRLPLAFAVARRRPADTRARTREGAVNRFPEGVRLRVAHVRTKCGPSARADSCLRRSVPVHVRGDLAHVCVALVHMVHMCGPSVDQVRGPIRVCVALSLCTYVGIWRMYMRRSCRRLSLCTYMGIWHVYAPQQKLRRCPLVCALFCVVFLCTEQPLALHGTEQQT